MSADSNASGWVSTVASVKSVHLFSCLGVEAVADQMEEVGVVQIQEVEVEWMKLEAVVEGCQKIVAR